MFRSIVIEPTESTQALAVACAAVVAQAFGWTASGGSVWQKEDGLRFAFTRNDSVVGIAVGNKNTYSVGNNVAFSSGDYYRVDLIKTTDSFAVGIRKENGAIAIPAIISKNARGEYKAVITPSGSNAALYLDESFSTTKVFALTISNTAGVSTSIVRAPDIWGGCMFNDLYMMVSCPYSSTDKSFIISGRTFRFLSGAGGIGFALCTD